MIELVALEETDITMTGDMKLELKESRKKLSESRKKLSESRKKLSESRKKLGL
jgi:hypothetical protein